MNNILLSVSLGLNLIMCTLVVETYSNVLFNLDEARNQYVEDSKYYFQKGCIEGTKWPLEYRQNGPGFNEHSDVIWCSDANQEMGEIYMNGAYRLGRVK